MHRGPTELIQARAEDVYERYAAAVDAGDTEIAEIHLDELRALTAIQRDVTGEAEMRRLERELAVFDRRYPWARLGFGAAPPAELRELDPQETPGPPGPALRAPEAHTQSEDREE